jgi:hypothetical protein
VENDYPKKPFSMELIMNTSFVLEMNCYKKKLKIGKYSFSRVKQE